MSATFDWKEDGGVATGSPAHGTTRTAGRTEVNWKNIDDATTAYSSSPITAGNNSYTKYQYGKFTGTFNQVGTGLWAHTAGVADTGITLKGVVTSTYAAPATSANGALTQDMTSVIAIGSGQTVLFIDTGPETASPGATCSTNPCYTQYLATQLQTSGSTGAGDMTTLTLSLKYLEN